MEQVEISGFIKTLKMFKATAEMYSMNIMCKKSDSDLLGEILDWNKINNLDGRFVIGEQALSIDRNHFIYKYIDDVIAENIGNIAMTIQFKCGEISVILSMTSFSARDSDDFDPCNDYEEISDRVYELEKQVEDLKSVNLLIKSQMKTLQEEVKKLNGKIIPIPYSISEKFYKQGEGFPKLWNDVVYCSSQTATGCSQ